MFSREQIAIVEFYFAIKSHIRVINVFQQKYPGETTPNASMITLLVQQLRDTGLVADRKRSGTAFIMKMKVADVETALQRNSLERPSVCINIITEFISLLKVIKGKTAFSKTDDGYNYYCLFISGNKFYGFPESSRPIALSSIPHSGVASCGENGMCTRAMRRVVCGKIRGGRNGSRWWERLQTELINVMHRSTSS
ncbi:DUF4817 domain-containing protein [Trichonephila clavipes]|uniref:DUF4817 domain-containing protein n=1 Tax=Trichonephila clavipes TaxID=2585209 RepID=A0A8X6W5B5_TRICX|nr:DUF4817 domain-containing protein [Trichonephila clavipes]